MKAKLIKVDDVYRLVEVTKHGNSIIGTTDLDYQKSWSDRCQKLSLKNCQAIERGYDLDELANKEYLDGYDSTKFCRLAFKDGFQKALELMGDKKFSEEQLKVAADWYFETKGKKSIDEYIQSLQQTEWNVEVEMEKVPVKMPGIMVFTKTPKLDADGCLILKRI